MHGQTKQYIVMGLSPSFNKVEQKSSGQQIHQHYLNGGTSSYSITGLTGKMNLGNWAHRGSSQTFSHGLWESVKDGREVVEITHHTLSTCHVMMLSCRVPGTILMLAAKLPLTSLKKTSMLSGSHSHFYCVSVIMFKWSGTDTFSRE